MYQTPKRRRWDHDGAADLGLWLREELDAAAQRRSLLSTWEAKLATAESTARHAGLLTDLRVCPVSHYTSDRFHAAHAALLALTAATRSLSATAAGAMRLRGQGSVGKPPPPRKQTQGVAILDREVSVGWASPSSRGLWGGDALLLFTGAVGNRDP